MSSLAKGGDQA